MDEEATDIKSIFWHAIEKTDVKERAGYIDGICEKNPDLRPKIEELLRLHDNAGDFLESPILSTDVTLNDAPLTEGPGTEIGPYKLLEKIGEGGMAVVYMAEQHEPFHRRVALKIIKLGMDTRQVIARFAVERQALAMMDHPNIAKVHDAGATETGRPYFVMELVRGLTITEYCDTNKLNTQERLELLIPVCNAVQHAHQKGIIHRDIKPTNIMVTLHDGKPVPKVIDFGIAKATNQRLTERTVFTRYAEMIGTPEYMSPEQAEMSGLDIDTRTDIYSLGVVLYELLTGALPFEADTLRSAAISEIQRIIREEEPPRPSTRISTLGERAKKIAASRSTDAASLARRLHQELEWIPLKAMRKDRTRRYRSASEFADDVANYLNGSPLIAGPESATYRFKKLLKRHRMPAAVIMTATASLIIGLILSTAMFIRAEKAHQDETKARAEAEIVTDFLTNDLLASVYPERAKGQEVTVRHILKAASANLESKFKSRPLTEAKIRHTLGRTYDKMGDYEAANVHLQRALQIRSEQLGEDDPSTLAIIDDVGWLRCNQGRYEQSESLLIKAYEGRRQILGGEHPDTIESLVNLGAQYMMQAQFRKGMELSEKAFEMANRILGDEHLITLRSRTAVVLGYDIAAEFDVARSLASKGLEISRRLLGNEHGTTLDMMNLLIWACMETNHLDESRRLAPEALAISQEVFGEEHLTTMMAMNNLGYLYLKQDRFDEAEQLLTRSVELSERILGKFHGLRTLLLKRLTVLHRRRGEYEEQIRLLIEALNISRQTHGQYHLVTGYMEAPLKIRESEFIRTGREQFSAGNYQEALTSFAKAGEIHRAIFKKSNPSEIGFMARSLYLLGRQLEAREMLDRLRMIYEHGMKAHEESHLYRTEQLFSQNDNQVVHAWSLLEVGELEKASAAVAELSERPEVDDSLVTTNLRSIAKALARAYCLRGKRAEFDGRYEEANNDYQTACQICPDYALPLCRLAWLQATCPQNQVRDGEAAVRFAADACVLTEWKNAEYVDALAAAYAEAGDFAAAVEWQQKAIDLLGQDSHKGIHANYTNRLQLYKLHTPFRIRHQGTIVAWWRFDEVVNGKILDASVNGHHGDVIGNANIFVDPDKGRVLSLTGEGYVDCGNPAAFNITGPITITAWIKLDTPASRPQRLIGNGAWNIYRYTDSGGARNSIGFNCNGLEGPDDYSWSMRGNTNMELGIWHHIVGVNDGMKMSIYIDGILDLSRNVQGAICIKNWPLYIGSNSWISSRKWKGLIDDLCIYDFALSHSEIVGLSKGFEPVID
jgi:serine/threonine protein kinase